MRSSGYYKPNSEIRFYCPDIKVCVGSLMIHRTQAVPCIPVLLGKFGETWKHCWFMCFKIFGSYLEETESTSNSHILKYGDHIWKRAKQKIMVYALEKRQLNLIKWQNAAESRGILTRAISPEGCINRPILGLIVLIDLTKEIRVPADYLFLPYSL